LRLLQFGKLTAEVQRAQIEIQCGTAVIPLPSLIFAKGRINGHAAYTNIVR